jgi:transposase
MSRTSTYKVCLTAPEREVLHQFVKRGQKKAREITRARILLAADAGTTDLEMVALFGVSRPTIASMRKKYTAGGYRDILALLPDAPRSGRPLQVDSRVEAQIALLACSDPPEGVARWTLHLIADKLVKLEVIDAISYESVRRALKKTA